MKKFVTILFVALFLFLLGVINLDTTPPPWWDEGWTIAVARNWVERGCYCRVQNGELAPPGLEAAFPTTGLVALSFRLLGVGMVQGRLVSILYTLAACFIFYHLIRYLYNPAIALGTLGVLMLTPMHPLTHPIYNARQVLAEPAMLFFLLAGYGCLCLALRKPFVFIPLAVFFLGVAVISKAQVLPFWFAGFGVPFAIALWKRKWRLALLFAVTLGGSYGVSQLLLWGISHWVLNPVFPSSTVNGLMNVVTFVPQLDVRWSATQNVLEFALSTLLGLGYAVWRLVRGWGDLFQDDKQIIRLVLLTFAGSWLGWYLVFANAWVMRYLYPPVFLSAPFVALLLYDLTNRFDWKNTILRANIALRRIQFDLQSLRALLAICLVAISVPFTVLVLGASYFIDSSESARQVANYINTRTPANALVETYESELFLFLDRRYHYPPDQVHVDSGALLLGSSVPANYDPLVADPDYLVLGAFGSGWRVYDSALARDAFRKIITFDRYWIYERVR